MATINDYWPRPYDVRPWFPVLHATPRPEVAPAPLQHCCHCGRVFTTPPTRAGNDTKRPENYC